MCNAVNSYSSHIIIRGFFVAFQGAEVILLHLFIVNVPDGGLQTVKPGEGTPENQAEIRYREGRNVYVANQSEQFNFLL